MQSKSSIVEKVEPIEEFLKIIDDNKWHSISEFTSKGTMEIINLLEKYDFIIIDKSNEKIRIDPSLSKLRP